MKRRDFFKLTAVAVASVPAVVTAEPEWTPHPKKVIDPILDCTDAAEAWLRKEVRRIRKGLPSRYKMTHFYHSVGGPGGVFHPMCSYVTLGRAMYAIELHIKDLLYKTDSEASVFLDGHVSSAIRILDGLVFSSRRV